jgi:hypothetical protein
MDITKCIHIQYRSLFEALAKTQKLKTSRAKRATTREDEKEEKVRAK